jgi:hypothetical protein
VKRGVGVTAVALAALAAQACVAVPLGRQPADPSQRHLVVGLFPAIGEAHLNDKASNGAPLTPGLRAADYTLRPLYIAALNLLSLGFPTLASWLLEPYEDWSPRVGRCDLALLGYCKSARKPTSGSADRRGLTPRNSPDDDPALPKEGGSQ